jgi:hypothetical protein
MLFHRYFCSTILAQKYGIELWGVPKVVADNTLSISDRELKFGATLKGTPIVRVNIKQGIRNPADFKEAMVTLTPNTYKSTKNMGFLSGKKETVPFDSKTDRIWVNPNFDFGKEYRKSEFVPLAVDVIPDLAGVQHNPF